MLEMASCSRCHGAMCSRKMSAADARYMMFRRHILRESLKSLYTTVYSSQFLNFRTEWWWYAVAKSRSPEVPKSRNMASKIITHPFLEI
jgi:hypothetical protein